MPTTPMTFAYDYSVKRLSPGIYRDTAGDLVTQQTLNKNRRQYNQWATQFGGMKAGDANYDTTAGNLKKYGQLYGYNWQKLVPKDWKAGQTVTPPPSTTTPPANTAPSISPPTPAPAAQAPGAIQPNFMNYQSPMTRSLLEAMGKGLNTMQAYEPKNFEGSPLYQFQKQKGLQDLEKLMAARGLTNSGAEIQANSDFLANLNATESEKQRQYADQTAQRTQNAMQFAANYDQSERENLRNQLNQDLERRKDAQQFDANREDTRTALRTNFLSNILQMMGNSNIMGQAQSGLNSQTALTQALANAIAQNKADNWTRSYGGGGGTPPIPPSGGEADFLKILMGYGDRAGNNDMWNSILKEIF